MIQVDLGDTWAERLAHQPETGMGVQVAQITLHDGRTITNVTIANGRIALLPAEFKGISVSDIEDIQVTRSSN